MGRILMVLRPPSGGAANHVAQLAGELTARGHTVGVCGPHGAAGAGFDAEIFEVAMGREPSPVADLRAVRGVAAAYRRFAPDLIHAHGSKGATFARLARVARPRTPLIWTPHNFAFTNYHAGGVERAAYRAIETALAPFATRIIGVCEAEMRSAAKVGARRRARLVYNGVRPFERVIPNSVADELAARGPVIASVTELQPPKGVPTLLDAMPAVLSSFPDASLIVAGGGFMRPEVEQRIADLGIGSSVHLLGQIPDVTGVLDAADVFVLPSWSEAFPYSILEAMVMARAVVATAVGGIPEAVEDGVSGLLVAPRDAEALANALSAVLGDPQLARALGERARRRALERFSFEHTVEGVLGVYSEVGFE